MSQELLDHLLAKKNTKTTRDLIFLVGFPHAGLTYFLSCYGDGDLPHG